MKVHLIKIKTVLDYVRKHGNSAAYFDEWRIQLLSADWQRPTDIKATFGSADLLGNGSSRVVFDVGGNNYRLICKYLFGPRATHLFICWLGTDAEYSKLCAKNLQYTVFDY